MDKLVIGCGYLGQRVARRWLAGGHRVFATTRGPERARALAQIGLKPIVCDVLDRASLRALPAAGTVLHCVGLDRAAGQSMRAVYVEGLRNVCAALPGTVERFLYVSSTSVYGQTDGAWVDETSPTAPLEESGQVVLEAEQVLNTLTMARVTVLRFAAIYGPERLLRRQTLVAGAPIVGDADKWLNLIHVEDGADVVEAAEERAGHTLYNVCDDEPVRRRDFYTRLAELLGAPPPRFVLPAADVPLPPHEGANRRIRNARMKDELGVRLRYPSYAAGLRAILPSPPPRG